MWQGQHSHRDWLSLSSGLPALLYPAACCLQELSPVFHLQAKDLFPFAFILPHPQHSPRINGFLCPAHYVPWPNPFRFQSPSFSSSDKLRGWISWLLIFRPILKRWCFLNLISEETCWSPNCWGFPLWPRIQKLSHVLLVKLSQEDGIQPQAEAALWEYIFQIRSYWSLTGEVISRWTKSASSPSLFPASQSMVGNSHSQLGVFTMWQAQRHF